VTELGDNVIDPLPQEAYEPPVDDLDARAAAAFREIHAAAVEAFGPDVTVEIHADGSCESEPEPPNLPAPFGADGQLDLDQLRTLAPRVRDGLVESLRYSARLLRQGRGTVVVPEDTYDLVRRVTAAEEVLRQWSQAFTAAAAECVAIAEEEALTANGSYPGVEEAPSGSLFVPDGTGQRIAVRPDWHSGESAWDVPSLVGWLVDDEIADATAALRNDGQHLTPAVEEYAREVARGVVDRLLALGTYTPGARKLDELRRRLAGQQRDGDAAVIRQVRSVGPRRYAGVKVTREEA
jgi:hypothetical protein